jgi:predicted ABC-type transport system involved in lysophospholipase L1 biosynthesis ATPase subunit
MSFIRRKGKGIELQTSFIWHQIMGTKTMTTLIQIEHVSKFYYMGGETIRALDDISLDIAQGEFVAIMGPSGSGKSTLMNIIGCLDVSDEGLYVLDGKQIQVMKDSQLAEIRNQKIGSYFRAERLLKAGANHIAGDYLDLRQWSMWLRW